MNTSEPPPSRSQRVLSVICYVVGGFFVYAVCLISFFKAAPVGPRLGIMAAFLVPALIAIWAGLMLSGARNLERDLGIVLAVASAFTLFLLLCIVCLKADPNFRKVFPDNKFDIMTDYALGLPCVGLCLVASVLLLRVWRRKRRTSLASPPKHVEA